MIRRNVLTAGEFATAYADTSCVELVKGEVHEMSPSGMEHGRLTLVMAFRLETWARETNRGRVFVGEVGVITEHDPDTVRAADIAYFSFDRLPETERPRGYSRIAPELIVETMGLSGDWDATHEKIAEYHRIGVDCVWVIDANDRSVSVFARGKPHKQFQEGETLVEPVLLPGFSVAITSLFGE